MWILASMLCCVPVCVSVQRFKCCQIIKHSNLSFIYFFCLQAFCHVDRSNGGFIKGSRTSDNIFILQGLIQKQITLGKSLYVCFVDFSKAFDIMNRHILFYKLITSGMHGRVIDTLMDMYRKTNKCRIKHVEVLVHL